MNKFDKGTCTITMKGEKILMVQRADNKQWCFPGGKVEPSDFGVTDTIDDAFKVGALRELKEEAGVDGEHVYLFDKCVSFAKIKGKPSRVETRVFICDEFHGIPHVERPGEILDARFVSFEELTELNLFAPTAAVISLLVEKYIITF